MSDNTQYGQSHLTSLVERLQREVARAMGGHDLAVEAVAELARAQSLFPAFNSPHEGYATLLEAVDELWDEVKASKPGKDRGAMRKEAIQVAAMALRFVQDVLDARAPAADALLDYRNAPVSERADRLTAAEVRVAEMEGALREAAVHFAEAAKIARRDYGDEAAEAAFNAYSDAALAALLATPGEPK